jgi:hypothetical protein
VLVSDTSGSQVAVPDQGEKSVWLSQVYFSCFFFFVPHSTKRRTEQLRYAGKSVPSTAFPRLDNLTGLPVILHFTRSHMNNHHVFSTDLFGQHSYSGTRAKYLPGLYVRVPMFRVLWHHRLSTYQMITDRLNASLACCLSVTEPRKSNTGSRLAKLTNISDSVDLCYTCRLLFGIGQVACSLYKFTVPTTWQVSDYASVWQIYQSWVRGFVWTASERGLCIDLTPVLAFLIRVWKVSDCNVVPETQFPQENAGVINIQDRFLHIQFCHLHHPLIQCYLRNV